MIQYQRLHHVQICVPKGKEEEARKFYTDILKLKEIPKPPQLLKNGGLWFEIADIQLHIGTEENISTSKRHPAFEIIELEKVKNHLLENKVRVQDEIPVEGQKRFSFFDPFNNRIEFLELEK